MRLSGRLPRAALLAILGWALLSGSVRAQSTYVVTDVQADVSAGDAVAAREQAITDAQREGLRRLFATLAPDTPPDRLPDPATLPMERLVRSFEIASEQVGARRYVGRLNITYMGEGVRDALRRAGITPVPPVQPTLLVAAVQHEGSLGLWWEADAWRNALGTAAGADPGSKLLLPLGDALDVATLTPEVIASGNREAAQRLAARYQAQHAVLVQLDEPTAGQPGRVELKGLTGDVIPPGGLQVDLPPEDPSLDTAAKLALAALRDAGKSRGRVPGVPLQTVQVAVPLADLASWVQVRRGLDQTGDVKAVRIDSFARDRAQLTMSFVGDLPRLQETLSHLGLALTSENGQWQLLPAGAPLPQAF